MSARLQTYYDFVAARGCIVPGCDNPPELHHVHGVRSTKTGQRLRRRQHLAEYAVIAACRKHHREGYDAIHQLGEEAFGMQHLGSATAVTEWAYTLALRFIEEKR